MGVEKPDSGNQPVQIKVEPDQTLQHFDFVDSDEETSGTKKVRNNSIGYCNNRPIVASSSSVITVSTSASSSCSNNSSGPSSKKFKCEHSINRVSQSSAVDKRPGSEVPSNRKLPSRGNTTLKTDTLKDLISEDGRISTPQLDTPAPSPLKEPVASGLGGSSEVSESNFCSSLLDEVLSEKKLLLMRSPNVVNFFKRHQTLLVKRSSNILQLGTHNLMDKHSGKS